MMEVFEQKFNVELADITPDFGLKPTSVFKYYQETFARYCAKHGVAGYDVYQMGLKWVFGQTFAEFFDIIPIWNEEVCAKVWISGVKKLRLYISFEIETKRGIVAKGQSTAFILDLSTSRPKPVDEIFNHFGIDENSLDNDILKFDLTSDVQFISEKQHQITFSDLDYNNHTNNISYILLAFECMGNDYIKQNYPKFIETKYLQETFLNDVLKCEAYQNNNFSDYKIFNTKDNSLVCEIKTEWKTNTMNPQKFFEILVTARQNKTDN